MGDTMTHVEAAESLLAELVELRRQTVADAAGDLEAAAKLPAIQTQVAAVEVIVADERRRGAPRPPGRVVRSRYAAG